MKLFDFQEDCLNNIASSFKKKHKRVVFQGQTGLGKSLLACEIAIRSAKTGRNVCILVHRQEILNQFFRTFRKLGVTPGVISAEHKTRGGHQIYIAMVGTLHRRIAKGILDDLDIHFFIIDEAHWGEYPKVLDKIDCHVLGMTATPKTSQTQGELNEFYDDIVLGPSVQDLITLGRLCPARTFSVKHDFSKVKKKGKDFEELSLIKEFKKAKLYDGGVKMYFSLCPERKAICYCVNIQHSMDTALQFIEGGVKNVYCIDGEVAFRMRDGELVETDRTSMFKSFESDEHAILCNVGIATTGYDCPDVSCIIENFATMSITKHHQVIGRGARTAEGKKDFFIIDMGRNYVKHGAYGEKIDWEYIFRSPKEHDKEKPKKKNRECNKCGMVIALRCTLCPYCGEAYFKSDIEDELRISENAEEIKKYRLQTLPVHLRKEIHRMSYGELIQYGRHMNFSPRWARIVYHKRKKK